MPNTSDDFSKVIEDTRTHLEALQASGLTKINNPNSQSNGDDAASLKKLESEVIECRRCQGLADTRTQVVFGGGSETADLVFVGEAPGFDEDKQGKPFVGKAGQLLTKMIQAMKYTRDEVYICNVLKCRPPGNRNPLPAEVENCNAYLLAQLEILQPKVIVALGKFAAQTLLQSEKPISTLRGKFYQYQGIPLMPTYHPAYLLRNESEKKSVWSDLQQVMALLKKSSS